MLFILQVSILSEQTKFTPPPFHCKIRKPHYVFICINHEHETRNVNKVISEETPVALNPYGRSKRDKTGATEKHNGFEGAKTKNELV